LRDRLLPVFHPSGVNYLCTSTITKSEIRTRKNEYKFIQIQANAFKKNSTIHAAISLV
jgi:hypothetical protein